MILNILDFGATGKNKLLDTIGIQRALNIGKKKNVTVYIPEGTYHIAKALKIYEGTTLILDAEAELLRVGRDALLKNGSSRKKYYQYDGNSHIKIEGGTFNMNGVYYPYNNTAMCIGHAQDIELSHITFKNIVGGHGVDACGLDGVHIHDCNFLGFHDVNGDRWFSEAIQLDMFVEGAFPKFGVNDGTITKNVVIENCYFGNSFEGQMQSWNRAIGSHASRYNYFYENIVIQNNIFDSTQDYALTPLKGKDIFIHNNLFLNCSGGIRYLGVYKGQDMQTLEGTFEGKQGGEAFYVMHNQFLNISEKDALHIRSHKDAPHKSVYIIGNEFWGDKQANQMTAINELTIVENRQLSHINQRDVSQLILDELE
ncbi:pectate lyase [Staphylococcus schleiferi]|uniref:glycosyl hydrolase family 28-related protein n=1 Tax=Staphylococcus sp. 191 TaxID=2070016 RepID=UPI0013F4ADA7|nr:glycosyl hydrolase family 28-related protein [Staphylococcus sp. 191]NHA36831.1 pectate lyase [Staphylococcus schleiferi]NHB72143.1 pectate lyase [Staphylococcus sp. 191]